VTSLHNIAVVQSDYYIHAVTLVIPHFKNEQYPDVSTSVFDITSIAINNVEVQRYEAYCGVAQNITCNLFNLNIA
jgi:hypothetical protein